MSWGLMFGGFEVPDMCCLGISARYITVHTYNHIDGNGELNCRISDSKLTWIVMMQDVGDGWWEARNDHGQKGLVPESYLEVSAMVFAL
jgi:Variant SH3 domain